MISGQHSASASVDFRDHLPQEADDEKGCFSGCCFCRWVVATCDFFKSIKRYINNWWVNRSYIKTLHEYNISDVLEKVSGEDNKLGQGANARVERHQMVAEDSQEHEIAYKVPDISLAMLVPSQALAGIAAMVEHANYCADQEKKALAALSHPNIIKPVLPHGKTGYAKKSTVIEVKAFSQEEKLALKQDISLAGDPPDFDFDIIESVTTGPAGIPLPLADMTLEAQMQGMSFTAGQKDSAIRAMTGAVAHMHENGYVHLDIKPGNVLRKGDVWMLCDFGSAHHYSELHKASMDCMPLFVKRSFFYALYLFGTLKYVSPQVHSRFYIDSMSTLKQLVAIFRISRPKLADSVFYTDARQADAYSLGIVLFEVLTGVNPTPDERSFLDQPMDGYPDLFQTHVDQLLQDHKDEIGDYYEIVAGLLKSVCGQRMTVPEAQRRLAQTAQPD